MVHQFCNICIKLDICFSGVVKARASGSKVYLNFVTKHGQARLSAEFLLCFDYYNFRLIFMQMKQSHALTDISHVFSHCVFSKFRMTGTRYRQRGPNYHGCNKHFIYGTSMHK